MTDYYIPWGGNLPRLFIDRNGDVMGGAKLSAYKARTTTPINMYDGINGDVIGDEATVSDGDNAGYIERDEVAVTSADTVVDILGTDTEGNTGTVTAEITPGVYFAYRSMIAYERDLSTEIYRKNFGDTNYPATLVDSAVTNGFFYTADTDEKLRRFKPGGALDWTYSFTSQLDSVRRNLITDTSGNAYLRQGGDLLKISSAGSLVWTYNGGVGGGAVTANGGGETWMTQTDGASTDVLDRVDASGSQVWRATVSNNGHRYVALDSALNSYVVGGDFIQSFDPDGSQRWNVTTPQSSPNGAAVSTDDAYLFVGRGNDKIDKVDTTDGSTVATYTDATDVSGIAWGGDGFIYIIVVPAGANNAIGRKIDPSDMSVVTSVTLTDTGAGARVIADPGLHPSFYS